MSGLSPEHADYLAAGGRGFQLGDGSLAYRSEVASELYYVWSPVEELELTADVQGYADPGMNAARQPIAVFGLRVHLHY